MENIINEQIMEKADKLNVKVTGLDKVPTIIQGRPLFDFGDVDTSILEKFGQDEDGLFQASGMFNIALHPDGRVEGLKTVSKQYQVVQHNEAVWKLFDSLPELYELGNIDIHTSHDGGNCVAYFKSNKPITIKPGDDVYPRTFIKNSADATVRLLINSALWRLVCSNGMMRPDNRFTALNTRKLHKGSLDLDAEVQKYIESIENDIESVGLWSQYAQKSLKAPDIDTIFQQLEIGPRVQDELLNTPLRGENKSVKALIDANALTGWDFYNSFTQRITDSDSTESVKIENGIKVSNIFDKLLIAA
ncbi:MAG: DUF932 domain-containing protein [Candidatus Tenebribacter davisii]|nr:DUF932 domain-containing protein [Candidatus Tenebribacter davisii]